MRLRVSVSTELAELIDLLAWVQIDTAQGVIRRALAEWVVAQLEAHADLESMTVDQYVDLHVARRFVGLPPRHEDDRRR